MNSSFQSNDFLRKYFPALVLSFLMLISAAAFADSLIVSGTGSKDFDGDRNVTIIGLPEGAFHAFSFGGGPNGPVCFLGSVCQFSTTLIANARGLLYTLPPGPYGPGTTDVIWGRADLSLSMTSNGPVLAQDDLINFTGFLDGTVKVFDCSNPPLGQSCDPGFSNPANIEAFSVLMQTYNIHANAVGNVGVFGGLPANSGEYFIITDEYVSFNTPPPAVPEPASLAFVSAGLGFWIRRKRQGRTSH